MSASTSSSYNPRIKPFGYAIFLSFSGEETRRRFTAYLYKALVGREINTFRDDKNLERGEYIAPELLKAIGESWGSIIVLSEGYAFSSWCLDELAEIVKQSEETGHKIFPIFYHVDPADFRHQRNKVEEALDKHIKRFNEEKIRRWRDALTKVANISGWHLQYQSEPDFIEDIVEDVWVKLSQTDRAYSHMKEIHSTLIPVTDDVRIIGICGMGGMGKTDIARVVYVQMSPHFEAKCFLADVGQVSRGNGGLVSLQKQLLSRIFPDQTFHLSNTSEGNAIISRLLPHKRKALIVMDDVDSIHQLGCLVGRKEWFGSGGRVIITTTSEHEHLLQSFGVDELYKPTTLDAEIMRIATSDVKRKEPFKRKLEELNCVKEGLMGELELHPRKKPKKEVELWLRDAERILGESSGSSSSGLFKPDVSKKIGEVEELVQRAKSFNGLVIDEPQWIGQALLTTKLIGEAPETCMKDIWACLMDDAVSKIGVWGMGGVGKTTIMRLIHNQLREETEKFNAVIWVTVSKEVNIFKLQKNIARGMKKESELSEDDDAAVTAGKIKDMLDQKGKYVLILDDVWDEHFSLEEIGIPEPCNGSKLVVTTRLLAACHNLNCQQVKVHTLSPGDAWNLFLEKVGEDVSNCPGDKLSIVKSVADECGGLPLAIVTIASGMKGHDIHEWRNALYELKRNITSVSKKEEKLFQQLRFSYDRLRDEKLKRCFLCCAFFPEDWEINTNELIELWIAEGLVEERDSMQAEIDLGYTILKNLKNSCLVESSTSSDYVKLHDIVRDMALRITSGSTGPRILVKAGTELRVIPDVQEWNEDLEKVSLMWNRGLQIPSQMPPPNCQKLTTLLLPGCCIQSIPECFFAHLQGLRTLDLSENKIQRLPDSISNLEALTTLLLRECSELEEVPSFSKLVALKKLDLAGTKITDLPHGMERLVNLRHLQFGKKRQYEKMDDGRYYLRPINGILAKLIRLCHLAIHSRYLKGKEIAGLRNLEYFEGSFANLNEFTCYVEALLVTQILPRKYCIYVGDKAQRYSHETSCITINGGNIRRGGIKILSNVESLEIVNCSTVKLGEENAFFWWFTPVPRGRILSLSYIHIERCKRIKKLFPSTWVLHNLQNLKSLVVKRCFQMEEIIAISESEVAEIEGSTGSIKSIKLPKLKELYMEELPNLKSICSSANEVMVCDSLEEIVIVSCPKFEKTSLPRSDDDQLSPPKIRIHSMKPLIFLAMEMLERKLEELNGVKEDLKSRMSIELHSGKKRSRASVARWLRNVEIRLKGSLDSLSTRSSADDVLNKKKEIERHIQEGRSFDSLVIGDIQRTRQALSTAESFSEVRDNCADYIWSCLMDDDVPKVGVWGKRDVVQTIMREMQWQLRPRTSEFNAVIWVHVSERMNIFYLQQAIAHQLEKENELSEDDDEAITARKIKNMLDQAGKYVLILEGLWEEQFCLEKAGIPEPCNGSKLVVTTELLNVCRNLKCKEIVEVVSSF